MKYVRFIEQQLSTRCFIHSKFAIGGCNPIITEE